MDAHLTISGYVGGAVEFRHTRNHTPRGTFRIGCTPRVRTRDGWTDEPTVWLTVVCWRSLAEHALTSIKKGDPVVVQGKLRNQTWTDDNREVHERLVVEATSVGHDLSRGTATFQRVQRTEPADDPDPETDDMIIAAEEEYAGESIITEDERVLTGSSG